MTKTEDADLFYVWLDLETTGANEREDNILEVGVVITDADLSELDADAWVLADDGAKLDSAAEVVKEMHEANNLAVEVESGMPLLDVESELIALLQQHGKKHDFVLAGSGVSHFDRRFLVEKMPRLMKWFRYYNIDVGVVRRCLQLIGRDDLLLDAPGKTHRALEDARLHLEELRHVKELLSS